MGTRTEFFELKTPADLFQKLERDLALLESSNQDTSAAYNFFVTAEHLPDWLGRRELVRQHAILRIVSHIANGAKHLVLDDKRHHSVTGTEKARYVEAGYIEEGHFQEPLVIHLSQEEENEMALPTIDAVQLGIQVVAFWRPHVPVT